MEPVRQLSVAPVPQLPAFIYNLSPNSISMSDEPLLVSLLCRSLTFVPSYRIPDVSSFRQAFFQFGSNMDRTAVRFFDNVAPQSDGDALVDYSKLGLVAYHRRNRLNPEACDFSLFTKSYVRNYVSETFGYLQQIVNNFDTSRLPKPNLTLDERRYLKQLSASIRSPEFVHSDMDFVIKPTDKGMGYFVMRRGEYRNVIKTMLSDSSTYELYSFDDSKIRTLNKWLEAIVKTCANFGLPKFICDFVQSFSFEKSKIPNFYVLAKVHKTPVSFRPIVASVQSVTTGASILLANILQRLLQKHPISTCVANSTEVVLALKDRKFPPDTVAITGDITSLYTNIDLKDCLEKLKCWLELIRVGEKTCTLVLRLAEFVLFNSFFQYEFVTRRQLYGFPMGTNAGPALANIYVGMLEMAENSFVRTLTAEGILLFYGRYLDDMMKFVPSRCVPRVLSVLKFPTAPRLKITTTIEQQSNTCHFLDVFFRIKDDGYVETSLFDKRLEIHQYLPRDSFHSPAVFKSVLTSRLTHFLRICSTRDLFEATSRKFCEIFRSRGYPSELIDSCLAKVDFSTRQKSLEKYASKKNKRDNPNDPCNLFISVLFHPVFLSCGMKDVLKRFLHLLPEGFREHVNCRVAYKRGSSLYNYLVTSK